MSNSSKGSLKLTAALMTLAGIFGLAALVATAGQRSVAYEETSARQNQGGGVSFSSTYTLSDEVRVVGIDGNVQTGGDYRIVEIIDTPSFDSSSAETWQKYE